MPHHFMMYHPFQDYPVDPTGWLVSEKLDGYRGHWDGKRFVTRSGGTYTPPKWWTDELPNVRLDGELWAGRGNFDTCGIVRRNDWKHDAKKILFVVWDAPDVKGGYAKRHAAMKKIVAKAKCNWLHPHDNKVVKSQAHLDRELERVKKLGGEGLVIHDPDALYVKARTSSVLKVKPLRTAQVVITGHYKGPKGKPGVYADWNGKRIKVANGFNLDASNRPRVGTKITLGYFEATKTGMPRFPTFNGVAA